MRFEWAPLFWADCTISSFVNGSTTTDALKLIPIYKTVEEQYFKKNSLTLAFHSCHLMFVFVAIIILLFICFSSNFKVRFCTVRVVRHWDRLSRKAKCPIPGSIQIQVWRTLRKCPCPQHGFGMKWSLKSFPTQTFPWSRHWDFVDFHHSKGSLVFFSVPLDVPLTYDYWENHQRRETSFFLGFSI